MDPTITAALIGAGTIALSGMAGYLGGRQHRAVQTEDLEIQIAERVVRMQEVERAKLAKRIEELEAQVEDLKRRAAQREQELMRDLESVRGERDTLRVELGQLRTQLAAKEAELAAAQREIANLHAVALVQATPGTTVTPTS